MEIYIISTSSGAFNIEQLTVTTQNIAIGCPPSLSSPLGMAVEKSLASDYRFRSCPTQQGCKIERDSQNDAKAGEDKQDCPNLSVCPESVPRSENGERRRGADPCLPIPDAVSVSASCADAGQRLGRPEGFASAVR
ncbi:uncharacterized protein ARB_07325 [Trichophyton benhamiae CBS 112371]|uniref:Uncharacterized protein n=1 Tax=Arthroderma benhamiae (strain ATCC MYA-4681 / CBS 112371) TaxID=663331 RepID=D4ASW1_ARTBC|nr:uncharacterized protein ARB_07325 [Trichophyton benhamiae CBS 112371]EFE33861.1 hypothetical protein ARB_07325 [Trichophyton benhamiae CBS 112371]